MRRYTTNCFVHLKEICFQNEISTIEEFVKNSKKFEIIAHKILGIYESAEKSRVVKLNESYSELNGLSLEQDELFREALRCVENGLFRAAHVLAWAGFIDFIHELLLKNFQKLKEKRPNWKVSSKEELREKYPDYQIIEAVKDIEILRKSEMKVLHGLLSKRNECAHPSDYFPDINETLGYISELLNRIKMILNRIAKQ